MAEVEVQQPEPAPALPDYVLDPNAVLKDDSAKWRYGRAPDYSKTRQVFAETKKQSHPTGSLPELVQNLVKNWEVEASFKTDLADWRTIDHEKYTFAINGGPNQSAEHMLKVGTYNAIISSNEYYCPKKLDFSSSHKTFKRMMPTFAWEVLEVYSGPPQVVFRWRHWGVMKNDYVGLNDKGETISVKAHGGTIDIEGVTVAKVDDKLRLQSVETWFDPLEMFRQIAPNGIVNKQPVDRNVYQTPDAALDSKQPAAKEGQAKPDAPNGRTARTETEQLTQGSESKLTDTSRHPEPLIEQADAAVKEQLPTSNVEHKSTRARPAQSTSTASLGVPESHAQSHSTSTPDRIDEFLSRPVEGVRPRARQTETYVGPEPGNGVAVPAGSEVVVTTHAEMNNVTAAECPFLMNRE